MTRLPDGERPDYVVIEVAIAVKISQATRSPCFLEPVVGVQQEKPFIEGIEIDVFHHSQ